MTTPPSHWLDGLLKAALTLLAIALLLSLAAHLIEAVLPVLIGIGIVALLGFGAWTIYHIHKSRW